MAKLYILTLLLVSTVLATDLDDYVKRKDGAYAWTHLGGSNDYTGKSLMGDKSYTAYQLNLTSQQWLTDDEFTPNSETKSLWFHRLFVIVPNTLNYKRNATLYLTSGQNSRHSTVKPNDPELLGCATLAMNLNMVVGVLYNMPNEQTQFVSDPLKKSRNEDAIIAFTFDHFLNDTSNSEWLLYFPMVKAAVKAMDAMTEYLKTDHPETGVNLDSFSVIGGSKRGWTTWLTGAVDQPRVKAIIPVVLDALNFAKFAHHQWRSYGGFGWALEDYVESRLMNRLDTPQMLQLQQLVDPYFYRDRLTIPKLVINAVLDEFQQPDDTHYWWSDMPGPKHFLMVPNAEHTEITGLLEAVPAFGTWIKYQLDKRVVPNFTWTISNSTGEIVATLDGNGKVLEASMWYADSCGQNSADRRRRRDFRIASLDKPCLCGFDYEEHCVNLRSFWTRVKLNETIDANGMRTYRASRSGPREGWTAFLIDVKYEQQQEAPTRWRRGIIGDFIPADRPGQLEFTTEVSVWPNTFPYDECTGDGCKGTLV